MTTPALTAAQMAEVDRLAIEEYGLQLIQMMENAGRALAEQAGRMLGGNSAERKIVVLCGAGNNGGGGMVAARHLHNRGAQVSVVLAAEQIRLKEAPAHQWNILFNLSLPQATEADLSTSELILDALIGYGLHGDPLGAPARWIDLANASGRPVLALDTPSGLDATTGRPGNPSILAAATLTLALPKTGLIAPEARPYVGDLYLADLGVPPELYRRLGLEVGPIFGEGSIIRVA